MTESSSEVPWNRLGRRLVDLTQARGMRLYFCTRVGGNTVRVRYIEVRSTPDPNCPLHAYPEEDYRTSLEIELELCSVKFVRRKSFLCTNPRGPGTSSTPLDTYFPPTVSTVYVCLFVCFFLLCIALSIFLSSFSKTQPNHRTK